jgi:hypothetical protein
LNGHTVTNTINGEYELLQDNKMKTLSFGGPKWANQIGVTNFGTRYMQCRPTKDKGKSYTFNLMLIMSKWNLKNNGVINNTAIITSGYNRDGHG